MFQDAADPGTYKMQDDLSVQHFFMLSQWSCFGISKLQQENKENNMHLFYIKKNNF